LQTYDFGQKLKYALNATLLCFIGLGLELELSPLIHTSGVECSVCFFYYRSLSLVRAGVNQRQ